MMKLMVVTVWVLGIAYSAVAADAAVGKGKSQACVGCHGADGNSLVGTFPKLAGQHESYLATQLHNFQTGKRKDPIMTTQVANLNDKDMENLAAYYASQKVALGGVDASQKVLGERVYRGGVENKGVPACMACHGPNGAGNLPAKYPALNGQHATYVEATMKAFREGRRGFDEKDDNGKIMRKIAERMSDAEIAAVASYVSGLH